MWAACRELKKFPHEVEDGLTAEELVEFGELLAEEHRERKRK
jgi:hypothetical protein